MHVECETCREALSARWDGEQEPVPAVWTQQHLAGCAACRAWQLQAGNVGRALRVRPAVLTPDVTGRVLASVRLPRSRGWHWRAALAVVAIAQLGLGMAQLFGWDAGMMPAHQGGEGMSVHLFDESTSWNLALGVGLAWAAWRTRAAAGLLPVFGGFLLILTAFCVRDLLAGDVTVTRVVTHGLLVIGFVLLVVVYRQGRRTGSPVPATGGRPGDRQVDDATGPDTPPGTRTPDAGHRNPLRPVSRHRAA